MNLLWHEPGRMAYERFHAVYVQCFCGSICIYIYGRVSWYYILSITSQGAPKSTRAHIYIYILYTPGPSNGCPMEIPDSSAGVVQLVGHPDGRLTGRFPERNEKRS